MAEADDALADLAEQLAPMRAWVMGERNRMIEAGWTGERAEEWALEAWRYVTAIARSQGQIK